MLPSSTQYLGIKQTYIITLSPSVLYEEYELCGRVRIIEMGQYEIIPIFRTSSIPKVIGFVSYRSFYREVSTIAK